VRQSRRALAVAFVILAVAGCASTTTLDVGYPAAGARRGMLASVPPLRIGVSPIVDRRVDAVRIGATPDKDKSITTSRSVPDIVRDALVTELGTNGHAVVDAEQDVILSGEVDEFWLDIVPGYPETHYVGRVALALVVVNARTGERVVTRRYVGIRRQQAEPDSAEGRRAVMDTALARTMRDLATDREFVAALSRLRRSAPTA
jgi:uncharacterized lipoprotein YajG